MGTEAGRDSEWTLVIRPRRKILEINLREILGYSDLIRLFVKRDFVTVYKQTILGPIWFILNPLFTTIVYTFVFGGLAKIPTDGVPPVLFYYGGTMLWGYFSSCLTGAADMFSGNAGLFSKVYFPRLTVPISKAITNLATVVIQLATLMAFYLYYYLMGATIHLTWAALALPLLLIELAALGTGFGLMISSLTTRYRDLRQLLSFGITLWMYATPIIYPLSQVPEKYRWILGLNPATYPIECFRTIFFGLPAPALGVFAVSVAGTMLVAFIGLLLFSHMEQSFIDVV